MTHNRISVDRPDRRLPDEATTSSHRYRYWYPRRSHNRRRPFVFTVGADRDEHSNTASPFDRARPRVPVARSPIRWRSGIGVT